MQRSSCWIGSSGLQRSCEFCVGGLLLTFDPVADAHRLIVIPLSFLRRLDSLKYTSGVALFAIAYLVVLVVYHFASGDTRASRGEINWIAAQGAVPILSSFPVIVFAYTCHQNVSSYRKDVTLSRLSTNVHRCSLF